MRRPRALLAVGAAAVVPLALALSTVGPAAVPHAVAGQVLDAAPAGQVLVINDLRSPALQGEARTVTVVAPRAVPPLGGAAEAALAVSGLLVLAGAAASACTGGARVRTA